MSTGMRFKSWRCTLEVHIGVLGRLLGVVMPTSSKRGELVASMRLDYEEGSWSTLRKLVGDWSRFSYELEAG